MPKPNKKLYRVVNGIGGYVIPKDKNGTDIFLGSVVEMPEPNATDNYKFGGWLGTVDDVRDKTGNLLVIDQDGDTTEIEPNRVEVQ